MPRIIYTQYDGTTHELTVPVGSNLMSPAVDANLSGIIGQCGGFLRCGTCRCEIDTQWVEIIGPPVNQHEQLLLNAITPSKTRASLNLESEQIDAADDPRASRLACQIDVTAAMEGLKVYLPESQY